MIATWLLGLLRARTPTLLGTIAGIAVTVGLMASLAGFISASSGEMTARASASVPVDWQVAMLDGTKPDAALAAMTEAAALVATAQVNYANVDGFEAKRDGTVQVTGPGQVVGIEPRYLAAFPGNSGLCWAGCRAHSSRSRRQRTFMLGPATR